MEEQEEEEEVEVSSFQGSPPRQAAARVARAEAQTEARAAEVAVEVDEATRNGRPKARDASPREGQGQGWFPGFDLNAVILDVGLRFHSSLWQKGAGMQAEQKEAQNESKTKDTV